TPRPPLKVVCPESDICSVRRRLKPGVLTLATFWLVVVKAVCEARTPLMPIWLIRLTSDSPWCQDESAGQKPPTALDEGAWRYSTPVADSRRPFRLPA